MTDHQGLPVQGYKSQSDENVQFVNRNKKIEELVLKIIDEHINRVGRDPRWINIAKTHIEQGFMALNRAVFVPNRAKLLAGDELVVSSLKVEIKNLGENDGKA